MFSRKKKKAQAVSVSPELEASPGPSDNPVDETPIEAAWGPEPDPGGYVSVNTMRLLAELRVEREELRTQVALLEGRLEAVDVEVCDMNDARVTTAAKYAWLWDRYTEAVSVIKETKYVNAWEPDPDSEGLSFVLPGAGMIRVDAVAQPCEKKGAGVSFLWTITELDGEVTTTSRRDVVMAVANDRARCEWRKVANSYLVAPAG